jgi:hypothetical protein
VPSREIKGIALKNGEKEALAGRQERPRRRKYWLREEAPEFESDKDDAFGVLEIVGRLAPLLAAAEPPFTLALSGSWGAGKTTIARELKKHLTELSVPHCSIDLWTEDIAQLRRALAIEVGAAIDSSANKEAVRLEIARKIDEASRVATAKQVPPEIALSKMALKDEKHAAYGVAVIAMLIFATLFLIYALVRDRDLLGTATAIFLPVATFTAIRSGLVVHVSNATSTTQPAEAAIAAQEEFRRIVAAPTGTTNMPVLVIVDNLDRLPSSDARLALREIRSFMEIPRSRCVFLVPIDRVAFIHSIQEHLQGEARDYLEKFFNLDIAITQPEPNDLRDWARQLLQDVLGPEEIQDQQFYDVAQLIVLGAGGSPRAIKRLVNAVSTRFQMLAPERRKNLSLTQLAFVEALVVRFPILIETLVREARHFVDLRDSVLQFPDRVFSREDLSWLGSAGQDDGLREEFARFLTANSDVPLSVDQLRDILSARVDRFWIGVPEPAKVVDALGNGDAGAISAILRDLDAATRARTIESMADWISKSSRSRYFRDVITATNALAQLLNEEPLHAQDVRVAAQRALTATSPSEGLARLTTAAVALVFSGLPGTGRAPALWRAAVQGLSDASLGSDGQETLTFCVKQGAPHVAGSERREAQRTLAKLPAAVVGALFEAPIDGELVNLDVADAIAGPLSQWDITADQSAPSSRFADSRRRWSTAGATRRLLP